MKNNPKKAKMSLKERMQQIGTVPKQEIQEFTRHFAVMLKAGLTVRETIEFLKDNTKNPVFKKRLEEIIKHIENGESLSSALSRYPKMFSEVYINIVHVGENVGALDETIESLADQLEANMIFQKKVKGALIYPKIVILTMIAFLVLLAVFVMPRLVKVFETLGVPIPKSTLAILGFSDFAKASYWWLIPALIIAYIGIKKITKRPKIRLKLDGFYLKLPIFGRIIINYNTAQVAQYFGTTFLSGLTVIKALEITKNVVANKVFRNELAVMEKRIKSGTELSGSFKQDSKFPSMFTKMVRVGERTGKLAEVVKYVSDYYKKLVDNDIKNLTTAIEPLIIAIVGMLIAGLVITVIGPIYELISQVG